MSVTRAAAPERAIARRGEPTPVRAVAARARPPRSRFIELDGVCKGFGEGAGRREVLAGIDLRIDEGELVAVVGFSGSGKSTLISLMAGLLEPDRGTVCVAGKEVRGPGADRGVMFQNYSLLPWLTVTGNVALAAKRRLGGRSAAERRDYVAGYVEMVGLAAAADKRPAELSGGMRQRVALARALALDPEVLLLDEPLGALDALTRARMQDEIVRIWSRERKTVVLVTNDVDEAILMADRIIPLQPGPSAALGPCFAVDLPRPRQRAAINHDEQFKELRNAVTEYLLEVARGAETVEPAVDGGLLPDLEPAIGAYPRPA